MLKHYPIVLLFIALTGVMWYGLATGVEVNLSSNVLAVSTNVRSQGYFSFDDSVKQTALAQKLLSEVDGISISPYQREAMGKLALTVEEIRQGQGSEDLFWQSLFYLYQLQEQPCTGDIPEEACILDDTRGLSLVEESKARLYFQDTRGDSVSYGNLLVDLGILNKQDISSSLNIDNALSLIASVAHMNQGVQREVGDDDVTTMTKAFAKAALYALQKRQARYELDLSSMNL